LTGYPSRKQNAMKLFRNILLVCDPMPPKRPAVDQAVSLARRSGASLTLLSVLKDTTEIPEEVPEGLSGREIKELVMASRRRKLTILAEDVATQDVAVRIVLKTGTPFIEIIREVILNDHDLVMMTADGRGGLKARLFGTTSTHLMRKCPCPVWVLKPKQTSRPKRILAAVDVADGWLGTTNEATDPERLSLNPVILRLAGSIAAAEGAELHVVQAWSSDFDGYLEVRSELGHDAIRKLRKQTKARFEQKFNRLIESTDFAGVPVSPHLVRGDPAEVIVRLARRERIDLLVMGSICRTGIAGFFVGNTAEKVLGELDSSVMTVKPPGFVTPVTV
jgi:universal stress protein E